MKFVGEYQRVYACMTLHLLSVFVIDTIIIIYLFILLRM